MDEIHRDLNKLIEAAHDAIGLLRQHAERLQSEGKADDRERETIRKLNMAVQVVEYDLRGTDAKSSPNDPDRLV